MQIVLAWYLTDLCMIYLIVQHRVEKYIFKYEPLYVARAETPQFDERFIGFGMTRNTQVL